MAKEKILVVEDELIIAWDVKNRLNNLGYRVPSVIASGEEAIKKSEEIHPDLVLMDIRVKGKIDGIEAAKQISDRFNIPVVYITACSDEDTLKRAKLKKPFGYISKPFDDVELDTLILLTLKNHKLKSRIRKNKG